MEFNEEHKVIIESLTRIEAKAFMKFLQSEIIRHQDDIQQAVALIRHVKEVHHIGPFC